MVTTSGGDGTAGMMASTRKVRLVVGLLGTAAELASALAELGAQGLKPSQINVIAQADALEGAFAGWRDSGGALAGWIVCRPVGGPVRWAIAAADEAAPITAVNDARALLGFHHWSLRRQARQLHLYLEQGGALLQVEPDTEVEERAACTALLLHASGGVQTHEIARSQER
jgi:hypothetical protein